LKAIYPGTFDPVTNGHVDVIKRGLKLFDSLVVAVAANPVKKPLFNVQERVEMLNQSLEGVKGVEVKPFDSLLVDFVKKEKSSIILRGLRETSDFPSEFQQAVVIRLLGSGIETIFVMTSAEYFYLNSSLAKEVAAYSGALKDFVPEPVEAKLKQKFAK